MPHKDLPKITAKVARTLRRLGITRNDYEEVALLMEEEAWCKSWTKDDWYHG